MAIKVTNEVASENLIQTVIPTKKALDISALLKNQSRHSMPGSWCSVSQMARSIVPAFCMATSGARWSSGDPLPAEGSRAMLNDMPTSTVSMAKQIPNQLRFSSMTHPPKAYRGFLIRSMKHTNVVGNRYADVKV